MLNLKSPRLILRPFRDPDLDVFAEYRSDPDVARYQSWTPPYTKDQAIALMKGMDSIQPGTPGMWLQLAVERQCQPGIIGDCAFQVFADGPRQAQVGYTFSRSYQKQGYAAEAVRCLLDYLFGELHLHRVTATCDVENTASFRLLERVGMRREAFLVENIWFKGAWGSEYKYAILDREWVGRDPQ